MKSFINRIWIFLIVWAAILGIVIATMPNLGELVRSKGQISVESQYPSAVANNIVKQMDKVNKSGGREISFILSYYNKDKLTSQNNTDIKAKLDYLNNHKSEFNVVSISNPLESSALKSALVSKDGTTLLAPAVLDRNQSQLKAARTKLDDFMKVSGASLYVTGADSLSEDFLETAQSGVQKTELISIIFILVVLIIIFRSPFTPIVSLMTVGLSFEVSLNLVLHLVQWFNFPLSSFTQIFLVIILFGIGTDYTMLLLMRFREELNNGAKRNDAILTTYKTAGKTVLFSSLTILIGFSCLSFAQFQLFKSATAVAVGVAVLVVVLFTFDSALMRLFGKMLFWSPLKTSSHGESKIYNKVSKFSTQKSYIAILLVCLVCCVIFFYDKNLSYDSVKEVDPSYPSVVGNNVIMKHFNPGETMPSTIAIKSSSPLNTQQGLAAIDDLTTGLQSVKGVNKVYSVTQPLGSRIDRLYLNNQSSTLQSGLGSAQTGVDTINSGLKNAVSQISDATSGGTSSLGALQNGMSSLVSSLTTVNGYEAKLKDGLNGGLPQIQQIADGASAVDSGIGTVEQSFDQLSANYKAVGKGLDQINAGAASLPDQLNQLDSGFGTIDKTLLGMEFLEAKMAGDYPELQSQTSPKNFDYFTLCKTNQVLEQNVKGTKAQLDTVIDHKNPKSIYTLTNGIAAASKGIDDINSHLDDMSKGLAQLKVGSAQLSSGCSELAAAYKTAASSQSLLADAVSKISSGSEQIAAGQNKLVAGISAVTAKSAQLSHGLNDASGGLTKISDGIDSANEYLDSLSKSNVSGSTFYIPNDIINGQDFSQSMSTYLSSDKKIAKITVTLDVDPYSQQGMDVVNRIYSKTASVIGNSSLKNSTWGISGTTQTNVDLKAMSNHDFLIASIMMLAGIFVVLLFITRDFWLPVFVMASLTAAYYIAMSLSGLIFGKIIGTGALSYNVPFFSFIMIVSLGVDYSIFLIMRYKENLDMSPIDSIVLACRKVGGVILSAAFILAGTFAAMYPSGVKTLMEVSITVILGIAMLCLLFIPVFIPAAMSIKAKLSGKN